MGAEGGFDLDRPVLGLESSCDETAAAVLAPDGRILAEGVLSQEKEHAVFGGVVPEIASRMHVEALDRSRLLSDVTRVLSDSGVNILSASVTTSRNRVAALKFTFEMGDPGHLDHVIRTVRKVDGVLDVQRDQGGRD